MSYMSGFPPYSCNTRYSDKRLANGGAAARDRYRLPPEHLLMVRTALPRAKYQDPAKGIGFYHRVVEGVRALLSV